MVGLDGGGGIIVPIPALVSECEWTAIQEAVARRRVIRRGRYADGDDPYLLRGMLVCGYCRSALRSKRNTGIRYYPCACGNPSNARRIGKPTCELRDVHAESIESVLWSDLTATLLDPAYLREGLAGARAQHDTANQVRCDRIEVMEKEMRSCQNRLDRLTLSLADATNDAVADAVMRQMDTLGRQLQQVTRERDQLASFRPSGLSEDDVLAIERFAQEVRAGIEYATPADRRRLYEQLRLRGTIHMDPDGVLLGRKHRFRIEWDGAIQLRHSHSMMTTTEPGQLRVTRTRSGSVSLRLSSVWIA